MRSLGCACLRFPGLKSQRLCTSRQQCQPCASSSRQLAAFVALLACPIPPPPALLVGRSRLRSSTRRCPTLPSLAFTDRARLRRAAAPDAEPPHLPRAGGLHAQVAGGAAAPPQPAVHAVSCQRGAVECPSAALQRGAGAALVDAAVLGGSQPLLRNVTNQPLHSAVSCLGAGPTASR